MKFCTQSNKVVAYLVIAIIGLSNVVAFAGGGGGSQGATSTTNAPASGGGTSSASLGGTILAYQSLKFIGTNIADKIIGTLPALPAGSEYSIYVTTTPPNNTGLQAAYLFEKVFYKKLIYAYLSDNKFKSKFQGIVPNPMAQLKVDGSGTPPKQSDILGGLIGSGTVSDAATAATTVLAQFRTAITTTDNSITVDNLGLLPSLCSELKAHDIHPITADFYMDGTPLFEADTLLSTIMYAAEIRAFGENYSKDPNSDPTSAKKIALFNTSYDNLSSNLVTMPLSGFVSLDLLYGTLSRDNTYLLYVSDEYAVGETRVKSNPIIDIFFDGPRTSYLGGAGVSYFLYKGTASEPKLAEHLDGYYGYKQFSKFTWWHYVHNDLEK
jgi:hypothetical protein